MAPRTQPPDSVVMPSMVAIIIGTAVMVAFAWSVTGWILSLLATYIAFRAVRGWGDGRYDDGYVAGVSAAADTMNEEDGR